MSADPKRRERRARGLGFAVALSAMAAATFTIGWPAPGASAALGLAVYLLARGRRKESAWAARGSPARLTAPGREENSP